MEVSDMDGGAMCCLLGGRRTTSNGVEGEPDVGHIVSQPPSGFIKGLCSVLRPDLPVVGFDPLPASQPCPCS